MGSGLGALSSAYFLITGLAAVARSLVLPALLIYFITRPPVRQQFRRADVW
jgi:hypothetical protein